MNFGIKIYFTVLPKILPFTFGDESVHLGEYSQISCTVSHGDLPISFEWSFNKNVISPRNHAYSISNSKRSSVFAIDAVSGDHAGNYSCIAGNRAGKVEYSATLVVDGLLFSEK